MEPSKQQIGMRIMCNYVQRKPDLGITDGLPDVGAGLTCRPHSSLLLRMEDARDLDLPAQRCCSCPHGLGCGGRNLRNKRALSYLGCGGRLFFICVLLE